MLCQTTMPNDARRAGPATSGRANATDPRAAAVVASDSRPNLVTLPQSLTVDEAIQDLRARERRDEHPYYVYVLDAERRLVGVVSMRDLALARPAVPLARVMRRDVAVVTPGMHPEDAARLLRRHRLMALPVVNEARRPVGLVTVADVMDAVERKATEDVQRLFGAGVGERLTTSWRRSFRARLPWLMVNLALAAAGALVVGAFEGTIGAWTVLAMYLPVVAGMGGNASAQAMAVAIRGIAVGGGAERVPVRQVVARELRIGAATGLVTGVLAAAAATVLHYEHGPLLGCLVAAALLVNQTVACAWGATMPFLMARLGFDPAQSATIFTTALTDLVGFFTLLGLAAVAMRYLA